MPIFLTLLHFLDHWKALHILGILSQNAPLVLDRQRFACSFVLLGNIENIGYKYEEIESENPGPGPIDPDKPPVEVTVSDAEILALLNDKVTLEAAKGVLNSSWEINDTNVKDATWYVTKDGDNVKGANLVFTYERRATAHYVTLCKVEFTNPLTPQNIKDGKIGTPTYTLLYTISINPTIQTEHAQLADAIGDKLFGVNEGATRYIIDKGFISADPQLGDASTFTVIELTDKGIQEKSIAIPTCWRKVRITFYSERNVI